MSFCENKEVKETGYLIYLHLVKDFIKDEHYSPAFEILQWIIKGLIDRKEKFGLTKHKWSYLFVTANMFLHDILPYINENDLTAFGYSKKLLIDNLLENYEWIIDPTFQVEILIEKIELVLQKSEFAQIFYVNLTEQKLLE